MEWFCYSTIVCLKNDMESARNMKPLLYLYEMMSGLKINFSKSEIVTIHGDDALDIQFAELFNCQIGKLPIRYLGVPIIPSKLHNCDWTHFVKKMRKSWLVGKVDPCLLLVEPLSSQLICLVLLSITCQFTYYPRQ